MLSKLADLAEGDHLHFESATTGNDPGWRCDVGSGVHFILKGRAKTSNVGISETDGLIQQVNFDKSFPRY